MRGCDEVHGLVWKSAADMSGVSDRQGVIEPVE